MKDSSLALLIVVVAILLVIFGPFATIWSLNTLFPVLAIPYTFETWLAILCVASLFKQTVKVGK
jgi:hypothetical protein